jgi:hypothetical protein
MCNYCSIGITKASVTPKSDSKICCVQKGNVKAWYLLDSEKHEDILENTVVTKKYDRDNVNSEFVRIEITPNRLDKITRNKTDWTLRIDQNEKTVPTWYTENRLDAEAAAWQAWQTSAKTQILLADETLEELKEGYMFYCAGKIVSVSGSAQITNVSGSAQIISVYGSAQITYVSGSAQIISVYGSAQIISVYGYATAQKNGVLYISKTVKTKRIGKKGIL